jgi:hypothetical protein
MIASSARNDGTISNHTAIMHGLTIIMQDARCREPLWKTNIIKTSVATNDILLSLAAL